VLQILRDASNRLKVKYDHILLYSLAFLFNISWVLTTSLMPLYLDYLGYKGAGIGALSSGRTIFAAIAAIIAGRVSDLYGYKRPVSLSLMLFALLGGLLYLRESSKIVALSYPLMGLCFGLFNTPITSLLSEISPSKSMASSFAFFYSVTNLAGIISSNLSGWMAGNLGYRYLFLTASLMAVISSLIVGKIPGKTKTARERIKLLDVLKGSKSLERMFYIFLAGMLFHGFSLMTIWPFFPLYAKKGIGLSEPEVGLILSMRSLGLLLTLVLWGKISDRIGSSSMIFLHVLFSSFAWIAYPFSPDLLTAGIALGIIGIVGAMDMPARRSVAAEFSDSRIRATAMGLLDFTSGIASSIGFIFGGFLWDTAGMRIPFVVASLTNGIGAVLLYVVKRSGATKI